jgi:hypothetical protein
LVATSDLRLDLPSLLLKGKALRNKGEERKARRAMHPTIAEIALDATILVILFLS